MNPIITFFQQQLAEEAEITRKMLRIVPEGKGAWQPHPKSMRLEALTAHLAELPAWIPIGIDTDELDFEKEPYTLPELPDNAALLAFFEKNLAAAEAALARTGDDILQEPWTMRSGEHIHAVMTRAEVLRMSFSQMIHHRAQLGVFLRLLNIPIPGSYGPSADELPLNAIPEMVG